MKIKANVSYNEVQKVAYSRDFEVFTSIPSFINSHEVSEVISLKIDIQQPNNDVFDYDFYEVISNYIEDGDNYEEVNYICVKSEVEDEEEN